MHLVKRRVICLKWCVGIGDLGVDLVAIKCKELTTLDLSYLPVSSLSLFLSLVFIDWIWIWIIDGSLAMFSVFFFFYHVNGKEYPLANRLCRWLICWELTGHLYLQNSNLATCLRDPVWCPTTCWWCFCVWLNWLDWFIFVE